MGASQVAQTVKNCLVCRRICIQSLGWEDPLEKGMATPVQYSCLENSTEKEPGGLQPMGLQRVRHN